MSNAFIAITLTNTVAFAGYDKAAHSLSDE
jgi:hypothetical protein